MPAFRKRESTDSSLSTDNRSDNRSTVREPETWLGATSNQAIFFMTLMKLVFSIYDFKQLTCPPHVHQLNGVAERAIRSVRYLYRNRHIGLRYGNATDASLEGFSDSDWAVKHSTSGFTFHLGSASISWSSKKQTTVALSSCEAEIMAGSEAAKEAIYLSSFLRELGMDLSQPPPLKLDNKSAIDLAYNPEHHSKTKHIERRHYFIRECVENGKLRVPFVGFRLRRTAPASSQSLCLVKLSSIFATG